MSVSAESLGTGPAAGFEAVDEIELEAALDPHDVRVARAASGVLRAFNLAGVLTAADVHVALRLARLCGIEDEDVLLAVALAVRAPRLGHVCVDLATIRSTASTDLEVVVDLQQLPWPELASWRAGLTGSDIVGDDRPLRLEGDVLYLDRYWSAECAVARELLERSAGEPVDVDEGVLAGGLRRLFPERQEAAGVARDAGEGSAGRTGTGQDAAGAGGGVDLQRLAAVLAVSNRLAVIAGGPGTGKTTTVARVLALIVEQAEARGERAPLVALAAPTGKAAQRLQQAVHETARALDTSEVIRGRLLDLRGVTIHRLLGWNPRNHTRFRHHRLNHLAHDVVVVDETSMVPLTMMARLLDALRRDAHLVLLGDPEQLASVEAGAVLGDIVGPAGESLRMRRPASATLARRLGEPVPATDPPAGTPIGDGIVVLRQIHRYQGAIAQLAEAVHAGDADSALSLLENGGETLSWLPWDASLGTVDDAQLALLKGEAVVTGSTVIRAARDGRGEDALQALGRFRVLCAHRRGPAGAQTWMTAVERWLSREMGGLGAWRAGAGGASGGIAGGASGGAAGGGMVLGATGAWYPGRPLIVTENDYSLRLFNGDVGVIVATGAESVAAVFERGGSLVQVSPARLAAVDTVYAMTVHKSQGSQFETVAVVLPPPDSPVLTRELLYTAVTRARRRVLVAGTEEALRTAIARPIARASGLGRRLWGDGSAVPPFATWLQGARDLGAGRGGARGRVSPNAWPGSRESWR